tara:strand:+ start:416 stop:700 length:285 start_codon:yes stop_codon:yes gene_type:complete
MTTIKELGEILSSSEGLTLETKGLGHGCVWRDQGEGEVYDLTGFEYRVKAKRKVTYYRVISTNKGIVTYELDHAFPDWSNAGVYRHIHDFMIEK